MSGRGDGASLADDMQEVEERVRARRRSRGRDVAGGAADFFTCGTVSLHRDGRKPTFIKEEDWQ